MTGADNFLQLQMPARANNVGIFRTLGAAFATQLPFTLPDVEEIKVAISEAVSNIVLHAYPERDGMMYMQAAIAGGQLVLEVWDEGIGIADLQAARQPSSSSDPERMGLGFMFMESFMDELHVESSEGHGTRVRMVKKAAGQPATADSR